MKKMTVLKKDSHSINQKGKFMKVIVSKSFYPNALQHLLLGIRLATMKSSDF